MTFEQYIHGAAAPQWAVCSRTTIYTTGRTRDEATRLFRDMCPPDGKIPEFVAWYDLYDGPGLYALVPMSDALASRVEEVGGDLAFTFDDDGQAVLYEERYGRDHAADLRYTRE